MLKDGSVLVGNCNSHDMFSFFCNLLRGLCRVSAASMAAERSCAVAQAVASACDHERLAANQAVCNLCPCRFVDFGRCCPRNIHLRGALLVGVFHQVDQPHGFVFIHGQRFRRRDTFGYKAVELRLGADAPPSTGSCHCCHSVSDICR